MTEISDSIDLFKCIYKDLMKTLFFTKESRFLYKTVEYTSKMIYNKYIKVEDFNYTALQEKSYQYRVSYIKRMQRKCLISFMKRRRRVGCFKYDYRKITAVTAFII